METWWVFCTQNVWQQIKTHQKLKWIWTVFISKWAIFSAFLLLWQLKIDWISPFENATNLACSKLILAEKKGECLAYRITRKDVLWQPTWQRTKLKVLILFQASLDTRFCWRFYIDSTVLIQNGAKKERKEKKKKKKHFFCFCQHWHIERLAWLSNVHTSTHTHLPHASFSLRLSPPATALEITPAVS